MTDDTPDNALLLLGCPAYPVQTSVALYLCWRLRERGILPVIAGTTAARNLCKIGDPEGHYTGEILDIDRCIGDIAEKRRDFGQVFVFIHNDAGVAYGATLAAISGGKHYSVIFGKEAEEIAAAPGCETTVISAPATHNPAPLKRALDEVIGWDA